jgi:starch-binding outer membrane protein, SusD/RagB family
MKNKFLLVIIIVINIVLFSCEKLDKELMETPYSTVVEENFFKSKEDVIRLFLMSYDQAYRSVVTTFELENTNDQIMTPNRQGHWYNLGIYYRQHYHTWTTEDVLMAGIWNTLYRGISSANNTIEVLQELDNEKFGISQTEIIQWISELRVLRAWWHLRLFDLYRNIVISDVFKGGEQNPIQLTPKEIFAFIEKELKESSTNLPTKETPGYNIGRWTKAGAMSLLVRLYLNAKVYINEEKYNECAVIAQDIIDGKYGNYNLEDEWDAVFDYNNNESPEIIMGFPSKYGYASYHQTTNMQMYAGCIPYRAEGYFGFKGLVTCNFKHALQPSRDVDSVEYSFELGKPLAKFYNYPDDIRLKKYKNLGNSEREGMFLWGYLPDAKTGVNIKGTKGYDYFIRDQVGIFNRIEDGQAVPYGPGEGHLMTDKQSDMTHADENSGVFVIKYPYYPGSDPNSFESAYAEIRLAEIYYSLAECKFRAGNKGEASMLLNAVRQRYYPSGSESLYNTDGSELTEIELLDEWGREFLVEQRRRTDLIRFNKFITGTWWDHSPSNSDHLKIFPIGEAVLNVNSNLQQNPGY